MALYLSKASKRSQGPASAALIAAVVAVLLLAMVGGSEGAKGKEVKAVDLNPSTPTGVAEYTDLEQEQQRELERLGRERRMHMLFRDISLVSPVNLRAPWPVALNMRADVLFWEAFEARTVEFKKAFWSSVKSLEARLEEERREDTNRERGAKAIRRLVQSHATGKVQNFEDYADRYVSKKRPMSERRINLNPVWMSLLNAVPLCAPQYETIEVINPSSQRNVGLYHYTSYAESFHITNFRPVLLKPAEKVNLSVVFLPRRLGPTEENLVLHTTVGDFRYTVKGTATESEYGLEPMLGLSVTLGAVIEPEVVVRNPRGEALEIKEVYSADPFLDIVLPRPRFPGDEPWRVEPGFTKAVASFRFEATSVGRFQSYIHVQTNFEQLIISVDITVDSGCAYPVPTRGRRGGVDLGFVRAGEKVTEDIVMLNGFATPLGLDSIEAKDGERLPGVVVSGVADELGDGLRLAPREAVVVGTVTYSPPADAEAGRQTGTIQVKLHVAGAGTPRPLMVELPWKADVVRGSLEPTEQCAYFHVSEETAGKVVARNITVRNTHDVAVAVEGASVPPEWAGAFRVLWYARGGFVLPPGAEGVVAVVEAEPRLADQGVRVPLTVYTNITEAVVSLQLYSGEFVIRPYPPVRGAVRRADGEADDDEDDDGAFGGSAGATAADWERLPLVDFGTVVTGEVFFGRVRVVNPNPEAMWIKSVECAHPSCRVVVVGTEPLGGGSGQAALDEYDDEQARRFHDGHDKMQVRSGEQGVFDVVIVPTEPGVFDFRLKVEGGRGATPVSLVARAKYRAIAGEIVLFPPEWRRRTHSPMGHYEEGWHADLGAPVVYLGDMYPGRRDVVSVFANSTFEGAIKVTAVSSDNPMVKVGLTAAYVEPGLRGGNVTAGGAPDGAVLQMTVAPGAGAAHYLSDSIFGGDPDTGALSPETLKDDLVLGRRKRELFHAMEEAGDTDVTGTVRVDLAVNKRLLLPFRGTLVRPSFTNSTIEFGAGQMNSGHVRKVVVYNPTLMAIKMQVNPVIPSTTGGEEDEEPVFDTANAFTDPVIVSPMSVRELALVRFTPRTTGESVGTLYIRNNLTVVEEVTLTGKSGHCDLELFGATDTDMKFPLRRVEFNLTAELFGLTDGGLPLDARDGLVEPLFRKEFVLRNTGDLDVLIEATMIEGDPCDYGEFVVADCHQGVTVPANSTLALPILYRPSFSTSQSRQTMQIVTPHATWFVPLHGNMPHYLVPMVLRYQRLNSTDRLIRMVFMAAGVVLMSLLFSRSMTALRSGLKKREGRRARVREVVRAAEKGARVPWAGGGKADAGFEAPAAAEDRDDESVSSASTAVSTPLTAAPAAPSAATLPAPVASGKSKKKKEKKSAAAAAERPVPPPKDASPPPSERDAEPVPAPAQEAQRAKATPVKPPKPQPAAADAAASTPEGKGKGRDKEKPKQTPTPARDAGKPPRGTPRSSPLPSPRGGRGAAPAPAPEPSKASTPLRARTPSPAVESGSTTPRINFVAPDRAAVISGRTSRQSSAGRVSPSPNAPGAQDTPTKANAASPLSTHEQIEMRMTHGREAFEEGGFFGAVRAGEELAVGGLEDDLDLHNIANELGLDDDDDTALPSPTALGPGIGARVPPSSKNESRFAKLFPSSSGMEWNDDSPASGGGAQLDKSAAYHTAPDVPASSLFSSFGTDFSSGNQLFRGGEGRGPPGLQKPPGLSTVIGPGGAQYSQSMFTSTPTSSTFFNPPAFDPSMSPPSDRAGGATPKKPNNTGTPSKW